MPRNDRSFLTQIAVVFAATFAAGKLGDLLHTVNNGGIGPVWPAAGIALGALLLWGYSVWPGIAAGAFLLTYLSPLPYWAALVYAIGTTVAALIGTYLLRRIAKFDPSLCRLRDALALIVLGAFSGAVSASFGASTLYAAHIRGWSGFGSAWLVYWLGDSTGVLVVAPLVLTFPALFRIRDRNRLTEVALLVLLLTAICFVIFGDLPLIAVRLHVLAFAVLPFVMWAAIRFGIEVTSLSIFLVATVASIETALGSGPFVTSTPLINAVLLDAFFAVIAVTGLTLAATCSERKEAERQREELVREQAAKEAQLRLSAIVQSSEDAIASGTLDGIILSWNAGAEHIYGYTEAEAVGKPITMLAPTELSDEENEILERVRRGGIIQNLETIRVTKTGKRINVSLTISPIKDSNGRTVGISGIGRDITERKQAENRLREYERAVEAAEEMIAVVDRDYRILMANRKYATLRGMVKEQILGRFVYEVLNRGVFEAVIKPKLDDCFQGKVVRYEMKYTYPDLGERDMSVAYFPIEGAAGVEAAACIFQDITEHKQAEEALRESEEKFRSVYRDAGVGMVIVSLEGRFLAANPTFCDYLGYTEEELLAKTVESVTFPEDWAAFALRLREVLTQERGFQWFQKRCLHKSGRIIYTETSASVIRSREGKPQYLVGQVLDITKRKEAEEALSNMTRKLVDAQEQERARIGRELHDDINQRLAMLSVEMEQLRDNPSEIETRMQEFRKQIGEISTDVQGLSHDLHSSKLEYLGAVAGMKSWCKEFAERHKLVIDFTSAAPSHVPLDIGVTLFRVLQEALQNAIKHSGVKRFEVQVREDSGETHLIVSDTGRGFDVEAALHGKGLGLTSMRERVRLVGGTVAIESKPMGGTTIHVRVPLASDAERQRAAG